MYAKPFIIAIIAACGITTNPDSPEKSSAVDATAASDGPDDPAPPPNIQKDQHFCCDRLGGNGSGDGCITIDKTHVAGCKMVLYCADSYENNNGHVTCL
jgi:hypothetical protein